MTGLLSGARQAIGQYFSLVSVLPSVLLLAYCYVLARTGGLAGSPDYAAAATVFGMAFALTALFFWDDGLWLLIALVPYTCAYLCYRGAIVQAHDYGSAMADVIAMNRFALYERLHLVLPDNPQEERDLHRRLRPMLVLEELETLEYRHPAPGTEGEGQASRSGT